MRLTPHALWLLLVLAAPCAYSASEPSAQERLASCQPEVATAAAEEMLRDTRTLKDPASIFSPALLLFQAGRKEEAVFWYYAGVIRSEYQVAGRGAEVRSPLNMVRGLLGEPILNFALQDVARLNRILDKVEAWDKATPNPLADALQSEGARREVERAYEDMRGYRARINRDRAQVEATARAEAPNLEKRWAQMTSDRPQCKPGQVDPAYAGQEREREIALAETFLRGHPEVRALGKLSSIGNMGYSTRSSESMPFRYEMRVGPVGSKNLWAIVDVARENGQPEFTLRCLTTLSLGSRDPHRDPCAQ